jgi:hypothetical protein
VTKKPSQNDDIGAKLAKLALAIADKALAGDTPLIDSLDAFKALTTYYVNTTKVAAKTSPDDDEGETNFANLRKRIAAASSGAGSGDSDRTTN